MARMELNAEVERLSNEVTLLRQQLAELRQFFTIEECDTLPGKPQVLSLRCSVLHLQNASNPENLQGLLAAGENGPVLTLWGSDQQARLILKVEKGGPQIQLGKNLESGVDISVDEATGRGQVAVMEAGKPRAVLKASETGGAVSVLHDDNHPRALLHATAESGEFIAVNQDLKTSVKISSDGLDGGLVTVHGSNGRPLVALSGGKVGGLVLVNDTKGKVRASLPPLEV